MTKLPKTLPAPSLPHSLPKHSKWLAGEGAGSWFVIEPQHDDFIINRFSPSGELECTSSMKSDSVFNLDIEFTITFPSHCAKVTVVQNDMKITLCIN